MRQTIDSSGRVVKDLGICGSPWFETWRIFSNVFCARFFYFSVTVLLEYLDCIFSHFWFYYISPYSQYFQTIKGLYCDSNFMYMQTDFQVIPSSVLPCKHDSKSLLQFQNRA